MFSSAAATTAAICCPSGRVWCRTAITRPVTRRESRRDAACKYAAVVPENHRMPKLCPADRRGRLGRGGGGPGRLSRRGARSWSARSSWRCCAGGRPAWGGCGWAVPGPGMPAGAGVSPPSPRSWRVPRWSCCGWPAAWPAPRPGLRGGRQPGPGRYRRRPGSPPAIHTWPHRPPARAWHLWPRWATRLPRIMADIARRPTRYFPFPTAGGLVHTAGTGASAAGPAHPGARSRCAARVTSHSRSLPHAGRGHAACAAVSRPDDAGAIRRGRAPGEAPRRSSFPRHRSR
jgi:hypothetical protein